MYKICQTYEIPLKLDTPNKMQHWSAKHRKNKQIKRIVNAYCKDLRQMTLPCRLTIIRISPRAFDYDNYVFACKAIVDSLTAILIPGKAPGRADADDRIEIVYKQEKESGKQHHLKIIAEKK